MDIRIEKSFLQGEIKTISSKSIAHRAIISAFISDTPKTISHITFSDDICNTINVLKELCDIEVCDSSLKISNRKAEFLKESYKIQESHSTLFFLLPLLSCCSNKEITFELGDRLAERAKGEFEQIYSGSKNKFELIGNQIHVKGFPIKSRYKISTEHTSQLVSGILFLFASLDKKVEIEIDSMNSIQYIDLTIKVMKDFGYNVFRLDNVVFVSNNQKDIIKDCNISSDGTYYSMLKALNSKNDMKITCAGFDTNDKDFDFANKYLNEKVGLPEETDLSNNPDLICYLAFYASFGKKPIKFVNIERLSHKESNRITKTKEVLKAFGIKAEATENSLTVYPSIGHEGIVDVSGDHREAHLAIMLASYYGGTIKNVDSITKSSPHLLYDLKKAGLKYEVLSREIDLKLEENNSKIIFKENLLSDLTRFKEKESRYVVITDPNIPKEYVEKASKAFETNLIYTTSSCGEDVKTIEEVEKVYDYLLKNNISKSDYVVALGGGTITDLTGYVAATYKRGMNLILIPTTVLAMSDAAIGFKNGINSKDVKNAIGSFYAPKYVFVDPTLSKTLSKEEVNNGLAEIIKIFALRSEKLFYQVFCDKENKNLYEWIFEAIKLKSEYVLADPYDKRERHALNLGHTIGHAIELKEGLPHGYAVAKGMVLESKNKELKECLKSKGFDVESNTKECDTSNDKKIFNNKILNIELVDIGNYKLVETEL